MGRKRKKPLRPRRLRMKRPQRLRAARQWLKTQTGRAPEEIAKSYRTWFGLDWQCAIQELETLGIHFDANWVTTLYRSLEAAQQARRRKREEMTAQDDCDSDDYFAYIAGYTPGGAAYGITWEEWKQLEDEGQSSDRDPF